MLHPATGMSNRATAWNRIGTSYPLCAVEVLKGDDCLAGGQRSNTTSGTARRLGLERPVAGKLAFKGTVAYAIWRLPGGKRDFIEYTRLSEEYALEQME